MLVSSVVKRQSTRIASRLRCCCHAPTSRRRTLWSGIRGPGIAGTSEVDPGKTGQLVKWETCS